MALFGSKKKPATPNGALEYMIKNITDGKIDEIMDTFQIGGKYRDRVASLPGIAKAVAASQGKRIFKNSMFKLGGVKMNGSNEAAIQAAGKTFDGKALAEDAAPMLQQKAKELGLLNGNIDKKKAIAAAPGIIGELVKLQKPTMTKGIINMVKVDGEWQIKDRDELTNILCGATVSEMVPVIKAKIAEMKK